MGERTRIAVRLASAGMTLIEMLIVLAVVAAAAGAVSLGIGSATRAPSVESEARRLASRIQAAADDAMLGDRLVALVADAQGYGFATYQDGRWAVRKDEALRYHRLPGGIDMALSTRPPLVLGLEGSTRPMSATLAHGAQRWLVVFDGLTATVTRAPAA